MKNMNTNELWVQNIGKSDVMLYDLNVKVPKGTTVNVYRSNPRLTPAQVKASIKSGYILSRTTAGKIRIVRKNIRTRPETIKHIKENKDNYVARKTKSSVVIEDVPSEISSAKNTFEFADYGVSDDVVDYKKDKESVLVEVKDGPESEPISGVKTEIKQQAGISKQTQIVVDTAEKAYDMRQDLADMKTKDGNPFVVAGEKPKEIKKSKVIKRAEEFSDILIDGASVVGSDEEEVKKNRVSVFAKSQKGAVVMDKFGEESEVVKLVENAERDLGIIEVGKDDEKKTIIMDFKKNEDKEEDKVKGLFGKIRRRRRTAKKKAVLDRVTKKIAETDKE